MPPFMVNVTLRLKPVVTEANQQPRVEVAGTCSLVLPWTIDTKNDSRPFFFRQTARSGLPRHHLERPAASTETVATFQRKLTELPIGDGRAAERSVRRWCFLVRAHRLNRKTSGAVNI